MLCHSEVLRHFEGFTLEFPPIAACRTLIFIHTCTRTCTKRKPPLFDPHSASTVDFQASAAHSLGAKAAAPFNSGDASQKPLMPRKEPVEVLSLLCLLGSIPHASSCQLV